MTANRSRRQVKKHFPAKKPNTSSKQNCPLCDPNNIKEVENTAHFAVIQNYYPYSLWDSQRVADHLMIIPKQHTDELSTLPESAAQEFFSLVSKYEKLGYNLYTRSPKSVMKTIKHHHTHLIKPTGKVIRWLLFVRKPYIRWFA